MCRVKKVTVLNKITSKISLLNINKKIHTDGVGSGYGGKAEYTRTFHLSDFLLEQSQQFDEQYIR